MAGSFAIIYYGNTGSSWLLQTLGSAPGVLVPAFEPLEQWAWPAGPGEKLAWLRNAFSPPADRDGPAFEGWVAGLEESPQVTARPAGEFTTVGLKMTWNAVADTDALLALFGELGTKLVLLERHNRIKHALSLYRYHEEAKSQFDRSGVRPPTRVKLRRFDRWLRESTRLHEELTEFRVRVQDAVGTGSITTVAYEEFVTPEGKATVVERLARFLGFDPGEMSPSGFEKATPDDLARAVVNYDRLRRRYRRSPLSAYFED